MKKNSPFNFDKEAADKAVKPRRRQKRILTDAQKAAAKARSERWYAKNKAHAYARLKEWRAANRERRNATDRAWRKAHPEESRIPTRKWREANRARLYEMVRDWGKRNQALRKASAQRHYARKRGAVEQHTAAEWKAKLEEFGHKCAYCGSQRNITRDHVVPLVRGGGNGIGNIVPACKSCNSKKGPKTLEEFLAA